MDYIKKVIGKMCKTKDNPDTDNAKSKEMNTAYNTFNGFVKSATSLAVCGLLVVAVAAAADGDVTGKDIATNVEETTSEDGSAPGRYLSVQDAKTELVQSVLTGYDKENLVDNVLDDAKDVMEDEELQTQEKEEETSTEQYIASTEQVADQMVSESEYILTFSEEDYKVLCTIVEAEAGDQDEKGKILVANVILNRVKNSKFPDNITDVVFQKSKKTYQFSPTRPGGRYHWVTPTENTIECVERALKGEDYSEGAIYFAMKTSKNSWFNRCLDFLFKHGDHYFYKD